ncbi:ABC transporter ATP-binding protein [Paraburkholderia susongensis]|uniref:Iron complex transport system ATP-binding protein n=1 Tax=Paraburkholderia susongensis TaxID=1515439 RepID=A0A1X7KVZ3_9BURK|nr:ABC transporter ATP-binding protein [Paraburkholderia susongensis]SMG45638.1 iron complex transport system ATP-binding protein [Paraburkholderia susongensis]
MMRAHAHVHSPASAAVLSVQRLTLQAGARALLDAFTHTFYAGEIWCVAGPNGAGKTTLLSTLAGLRHASAGHVELDGLRLADWQPLPLARRRALMPQGANDAFSASVLDIVMLNRFPHLGGWGWERDADRAAAHAALERLGLAQFAARDVLSLSGGERQRVALAAVLCQDAPLLLLDEPLSHLDLHHQIDCLEALVAWVRESRRSALRSVLRSVLFSCHDLNLARRFATHALLLDGEGGAYAGPVRDVLTPALASRAFGYPLILIRDGEHEALIPAPRSRHESPAGHDIASG